MMACKPPVEHTAPHYGNVFVNVGAPSNRKVSEYWTNQVWLISLWRITRYAKQLLNALSLGSPFLGKLPHEPYLHQDPRIDKFPGHCMDHWPADRRQKPILNKASASCLATAN